MLPPFLRSALTLTAVDVAGLHIAIQLLGSIRQIQIQAGSSQRQFRSTGWRWPCTPCSTRLPGNLRQPRRAKMRCMARIARTSTHKTRASPATLRMEESREDEALSVEWCSMVSLVSSLIKIFFIRARRCFVHFSLTGLLWLLLIQFVYSTMILIDSWYFDWEAEI